MPFQIVDNQYTSLDKHSDTIFVSSATREQIVRLKRSILWQKTLFNVFTSLSRIFPTGT